MRRITILVAALVAALLAVTPAYAKHRVERLPSPTSSLAGTVSHQDLRGEHARDAARNITHAAPQPPVYWSYEYQAPTPKPAKTVAAADTDDGTPWGIIGGIAAVCLLIGGLAATGTRRRVRAHA